MWMLRGERQESQGLCAVRKRRHPWSHWKAAPGLSSGDPYMVKSPVKDNIMWPRIQFSVFPWDGCFLLCFSLLTCTATLHSSSSSIPYGLINLSTRLPILQCTKSSWTWYAWIPCVWKWTPTFFYYVFLKFCCRLLVWKVKFLLYPLKVSSWDWHKTG